MKQFFVLIAVCFSITLFGQCPGDFDFENAEGVVVSPDPSQGETFESGTLGIPYSDFFHILAPSNLSDVFGSSFDQDIDSLTFEGVLIDGIAIENSGFGLYSVFFEDEGMNPEIMLPSHTYCIELAGIPLSVDTLSITFVFNAFVSVESLGVLPIPFDISGYSLSVGQLILGCLNPSACNYNPQAHLDDGSCSDLDTCGVCGGNNCCSDASPPVFSFIPDDYTVECSDEILMEDAAAFDNCGEVYLETTDLVYPGSAAGAYEIVRTFTATDEAGNETTAVQVINVIDTTTPSFITIPPDMTVEFCPFEDLEAVLSENATAADLCGTVVIEYSNSYGSFTGALGNFTVTRTFTATDDAGNARQAVQVVTVEDTTAPEFTYVPADITIECSAEDLVAVLSENAIAEDCGDWLVEYVNSYEYFNSSGDYVVTRTFTAIDDAGNFSTAVQVVTVIDTTAPELTIPDDYTVECYDEIIFGAASATDNCGAVTIEWYEDIIQNETEEYFTVLLSYTATDDAGNFTTLNQAVTVLDCNYSGCTDESACNFDATAEEDDGSCQTLDECGICGGGGIPQNSCDCQGNTFDVVGVCGGDCLEDDDDNGICDNQEILGCTYEIAQNYETLATRDNGSCVFPCVGDVNQVIFDWDANGNIGIADFLQMLSVFGDVDGDGDGVWDSQDDCVDLEACNYDSDPTEECQYLDILEVCGGGCEADEDEDGICDDVDICIGVVDECGVCNGPGATGIFVEDIVFTYDSIFLPIDNEWFVYASGADTIFGFECPPPFSECDNNIENPSSLGVYTLTIESSEAVNPENGTVYRFYVNALNDTDNLSGVIGDNNNNLIFETPEGIFNSPFNTSWNASGINPTLLAVVPDLADDSYATIGLSGPASQSGISEQLTPAWLKMLTYRLP